MRQKTTVLAALVHDVAKTMGPFDTLADLVEATKRAAEKYQLPYNAELVNEALRAVGRTRRLLRPLDLGVPYRAPAEGTEVRPYAHDEAVAFLAACGIRL